MTRVQPIGAFPLPAGLLLVPETGCDEAVAQLLAGRRPRVWPAELEAHRRAHAGDVAGAPAAIGDDDAYAAFNRFVLDPESADPAAVAATLPPRLAPLVDVVGVGDAPPVLDDETDDVVAALVLAARATGLSRASNKADLLRAAAARVAAVAPPLSALLRGNAATAALEAGGDVEEARAELSAAAAALADTDLASGRAELHHQLGALEHEAAVAAGGSLRAAMHHYTTVLQLVTRDDAPYLWASTQLNLSTAYLVTPMAEASDQLRMGVAIAALRAALEIFTRDEHPRQWATATLNLANALVYTPSVKQGDNLVEAVELYETVLDARPRDVDPLGRARVLTNQGNALAHLGIFGPATAKLMEARSLFEEHLDHDATMTVRAILDEIAKRTVPEVAS